MIQKKNSGLLIASIVWFVISALCSVVLNGDSEITHATLVILVAVSYALCVYSWVKSGCRLISVYVFFIAYAFLCNCGQSLLYVLGVPYEFLTSYWNLPVESVSYAFRFQLLCVAALNVGTCIALSRRSRNVSTDEMADWYRNYDTVKNKADKYLFPIMIICLLGTMYAAYEVASLRSTMSYHEWMYEGHNDVESRFYFSYFFAFLSIRSVFRKQHTLLIYASWLFFIGLFMMLGLRTQAIPYLTFLLITVPVTHSSIFKKKFIPFWIVGAFFFIIFLGIISSTRTEGTVDLSEADNGQNTAVSFYVALADVGASAETIGLTMNECDKGMPHYQSILYSIITVIPNRVLKIPAEVFQVPGWEVMSSPGSFMSHKVGLLGFGFSYIAEAYLNYGWFGWIFILLYGILIARLENMAYQDIMNGCFFKITFLLWLAKQVFFARADLCLGENYIEYMIFTAVIYKLIGSKERLFTPNRRINKLENVIN